MFTMNHKSKLKSFQYNNTDKDNSKNHCIFPLLTNHNMSTSLQLSNIHLKTSSSISNESSMRRLRNNYCVHPRGVLQLKRKFIEQPLSYETNNNNTYTLQRLDTKNEDEIELQDTVAPIISGDFLLRSDIKTYFKYGKFDKPPYINCHIEEKLKKFYAVKENTINYINDIYLVPHFKCNLYFSSISGPMANIYQRIERNNGDLFDRQIKIKLCQERKSVQIIKDNTMLTFLNDHERFDFASVSYLNNKYDNYTTVDFASSEEKRAVYKFPVSFTKKYKASKTKGFIKAMLRTQTGVRDFTLTYLLTLHLDLHKKSKIFSKKTIPEVERMQRKSQYMNKAKYGSIPLTDVYLL